jgi:deoxyhypusine synthase
MKKKGLRPVRDIRVPVSREIVSLVDQMRDSGGFMGRHVAEAADILLQMSLDRGCTKFLSFPSAPVATGLRGVLIDMVREGLVDVVVTACGTIDHDIARTRAEYYHGSFDMDDVSLHREGYHRLGNVLVPLESYGPVIEREMQVTLDEVYSDGKKFLTTEELCSTVGRRLGERSLLYWCSKMNVPVFIPGITDGAVGSQLWLFAERHRDFNVDLLSDERRLSDIVFSSKRSGALVIGGGITKHHVIWWNQFREGLDYACYITTAVEYDGSLSGAQVREAVSWGKVKEKARRTTLYSDATAVLPLIVSYVLSKKKFE